MSNIDYSGTIIIEDTPWLLYDKLVEEEQRWLKEVNEIMIELGIDIFPSRKQFSSVKREGLYNKILNSCGKELFCDEYGIKM